MSFCSWWWNISCYGDCSEAFVYIECPWTSLASVLIKSLLAIPPGVAWWDSSHVIPPSLAHSLCFSLPRHALWTSLSLQSHIKALIVTSSFLFSRWSADYMCTCVEIKLRRPKQLRHFLPIINRHFLHNCDAGVNKLHFLKTNHYMTLYILSYVNRLSGFSLFPFKPVSSCPCFVIIG